MTKIVYLLLLLSVLIVSEFPSKIGFIHGKLWFVKCAIVRLILCSDNEYIARGPIRDNIVADGTYKI